MDEPGTTKLLLVRVQVADRLAVQARPRLELEPAARRIAEEFTTPERWPTVQHDGAVRTDDVVSLMKVLADLADDPVTCNSTSRREENDTQDGDPHGARRRSGGGPWPGPGDSKSSPLSS